ncbi:peroxisome biogenesis protein 22 isoform X2 [Cryptomeria japonica]|uniref:peroxisome biogenesis protein 22 isoform X2 n=1 Tax=Cryptomeria japonica TaxID=3369 RepID=UPI0025AC2EDB|nr:peroxisome biogenesis protein 22 isoform X2 [Cryptomeria japonica]
MENSTFDRILQIIRNSSTQLTIRVSRLIALLSLNKSATSIGAFAGLALAIVFTWRSLKAPRRYHRRTNKRTSTRGIDHTSQVDRDSISSSGYSGGKSSFKRQNVSPKQLTMVQVVRQKLKGARKVTCNMLGVVLEELSSIDLQAHAIVRPSVVDFLFEIAKACDLYLIVRVLDDESEERVLSALDSVGLFTTAGLNRNKYRFFSAAQRLEDHLLCDNLNLIGILTQMLR